MMAKKRLFRDHPDGVQLHAGTFRRKHVWNSDDGGGTWWSGRVFAPTPRPVTRDELIKMAVSILRDVPSGDGCPCLRPRCLCRRCASFCFDR